MANDSEPLAPDEFEVEKILDKRLRNGKVEYFIKWLGYPDADNTWEPVDNLTCHELIQEFERNERKKKIATAVGSSSDVNKNKTPEKILGATNATGELMFLIKWPGKDEADLVTSTYANSHW